MDFRIESGCSVYNGADRARWRWRWRAKAKSEKSDLLSQTRLISGQNDGMLDILRASMG
jgi:hypothetical protein